MAIIVDMNILGDITFTEATALTVGVFGIAASLVALVSLGIAARRARIELTRITEEYAARKDHH